MRICKYILIILLLAACSTTRNIPEDELLYRGISKVDYDKWQPSAHRNDTAGVISAIADAYSTVENLFSANGAKQVNTTHELSKEELDSLQQMDKVDRLHYEDTQDEVKAVLAYAPNGSFMGSSYVTHPFPIRLWIYNRYVNSKKRFGKWMFNHFACTPKYITSVNPYVRSNVARTTLRNHGYLHATVMHDTIAMRNPRKAKVAYHVLPGRLFHIDSISYLNFPSGTDSLIRSTMSESLLHSGMPFKAASLDEERKRITTLLRNKGFYFYHPEYIQFKADTLIKPLNMQLRVEPDMNMPSRAKRTYHIGNTFVRILRNGDSELTDTLPAQDGFTFGYSGNKSKPLIKPMAVRRLMFYRKGDLYRQNLHDIWQQKLSETGLFSQIKTDYIERDSLAESDTLDVVVTAMLDKPYDAKFEGRATFKSNSQVGPGATFSVTKANAFRNGEIFGFDVNGSFEWQTGADMKGDRTFVNSFEAGVASHLTYPRIMFFGLGKKIGRRAMTSTQFKLNARMQNRAGYFGRVTFGARITYNYQRRRNITHELTPFRIEYEAMVHTTHQFDSIIISNPSLAMSMHNQFVTSMEYSYNWRSTHGHDRTFSIYAKEAGNVLSGIYAIAGRSFNEKNKDLFGVPFAQFVKAQVQYTHKIPLTKRSCIATRAFLGAIYNYGNSIVAPYNDLFSMGGANSIRAFATRSIGPGAYHPSESNYAYLMHAGDLKLELNAEYRFPIVGDLYGAAFIDAGNVWLLKDDGDHPNGCLDFSRFGKDIALGTGVGLRYDLDILVLRFDMGIGIHAPYDTGREGYYNMPSFGKSLGFHFAIGYPF